MNVSQALGVLYPNADPVSDWRVNPDTGEITYWNTDKLGAQPSALEIARGWYLFSRQQAEERVGLAYVGALRSLYPEMTQPRVIGQYPEGWLAVLVTEVMRNNNPTRRQNAITQANTWTTKRSQIAAIVLSANPTEQEYKDKAAQLEAITW